jgi:hypothetical protein
MVLVGSKHRLEHQPNVKCNALSTAEHSFAQTILAEHELNAPGCRERLSVQLHHLKTIDRICLQLP